MADELFEKRGRRYYPVGHRFTGFPVNGVWYVEDGRHNRIMKVGDLPDPMPLAAMEPYRMAAASAVHEVLRRQSRSPNDVVDAVFMAIAKAMEING